MCSSDLIVHRDIKSSNLLLDSNMEAHLGDFGLAKALVEDYDSNTESNTWFAGSYGYIAPGIYKKAHAIKFSFLTLLPVMILTNICL